MITLLTKRIERECEGNMDSLSKKVETPLIHCLFLLGSKFGDKLCLARKERFGDHRQTTIRALSQLK